MTNRQPSRASLSAPDVREVPVFIYALCEPISLEVRYIGKSADPESRYSNHLCAGRKKIAAWIEQLAADGLRPTMCTIDVVPPGHDASARERLAIGMHIAHGARLLNSEGTEAGRGPYTKTVSPKSMGAAALLNLDVTQKDIAKAIGGAQSSVSQWIHGVRLPDAPTRARLEDMYGIYWRLWDAPVRSTAEKAA